LEHGKNIRTRKFFDASFSLNMLKSIQLFFILLMTLKESIHQALRIQLKFRIDEIQNILDDLHLSGSRDAKSSAGDKHETGVAMAQLEQ
jgi:hypothetical protein